MLPKYHILLGLVASLILYFFGINYLFILVFFFSSFLIDADHYINRVFKKKDLSLKKAYQYFYKKGKKWVSLSPDKRKKYKADIVIFHYFEIIFSLLILSYFYKIFLFIALGFLFHLCLDYIHMIYHKDNPVIKMSLIYTLIRNKNKKILKVE